MHHFEPIVFLQRYIEGMHTSIDDTIKVPNLFLGRILLWIMGFGCFLCNAIVLTGFSQFGTQFTLVKVYLDSNRGAMGANEVL